MRPWENDFSRRIRMENTPYLYDTLVHLLRQHRNWLDLRHLKTLAWMMVGLIHSGSMSLCAWAPDVVSRACYSQSTVRRFRRWLDNDRIEVHALYGPLMQQALIGWGDKTLSVALETSMLWNTDCMVRWSVSYRGRAVPLVWCVIAHRSAAVAYEGYKVLLEQAAPLVPFACTVVCLADRGCADTALRQHLKRLGWHFRSRIKSNFWIYRPGHGGLQVRAISLGPGQARFWQGVWLTGKRCGPVHLVVALPVGSNEYWYVISDEPTAVETLEEYGLRFDIEENFLDDKSNGFQLEASLIRSAKALERLCFVLAIATLYLVSVGTSVVTQGNRRLVEPHWFRGTSSLKIGWTWVSDALSRGYALTASVSLSRERDPEPATASKKQAQQRQDRFVFPYQEAA
jgi:hypothetical protein